MRSAPTHADLLAQAERVTGTLVPGLDHGFDCNAPAYALATPLRPGDGVLLVEAKGIAHGLPYRIQRGMVWTFLAEGQQPETITVHVLRREARP